MIHCGAVHLDFETGEENIHLLRETVSEKRRLKAARYLRKEDMLRSLVGECLCRVMIVKNFGLSHRLLEFSEDELGKPFLPAHRSIHFNLTHSGDWVGCAVGITPVGIDIERHKTMEMDIAKRFFHPNETDYVRAVPQEYTERFFRIWTLKESYIKAIGKGLHCPLDSFSVIAGKQIQSIIATDNHQPMTVKPLFITEGYSAAICHTADEEVKPVELNTIHTFCSLIRERLSG
jgi:4'-phosphopantetheinyl transferase